MQGSAGYAARLQDERLVKQVAYVYENVPPYRILGDNEINLEYTYAFLAKKTGSAILALRVQDSEAAEKVLRGKGIKPLSQDDIPVLFG